MVAASLLRVWPRSSRGVGLLRSRRPRIFLHIGAMKTGTTFLQELLMANQENLARAGYLFPGSRWADQSAAARDVLGFSKTDEVLAAKTEGKWAQLVEQMLSHRGPTIYSMEFLSFADTEQATRILESLSEAEVHVIITVRDAAATIPAQWQTSCRNTGQVPWGKFVRGVAQALKGQSPKGRGARMFQRTQGIPRMLDVWAPLVGTERVHVVTVPPRGSDPMLLWHRFAGVLGVDPGVCTEIPPPSNPSLGHPSAELLRRLNIRVSDLARSDYDRVVKGPLGRTILGSRASLERPVVLHKRGKSLAVRWNRRVRAAVEESGVDLVGDLTDLKTRRPDPQTPKAIRKPSDEELLEAAATARDGLLELIEQTRAEFEARRAGREPDLEPVTLPSTTDPTHWSGKSEPVPAAVHELDGLVRTCLDVMHAVDEVVREQRARQREAEEGGYPVDSSATAPSAR